MDWSIQDVARIAGTTSRTLRHYAAIGLLAPSSVGANGYRRYDEASLVRLQRILLLRELGLGLPRIAEVLAAETVEEKALESHLAWLRSEQDRLARQIASVEHTIHTLREGEQLMAENMFDGFDHTKYESEVTERWGADAYRTAHAWWRAMTADEKTAWKQRAADLARDWSDLAGSGVDAGADAAQTLAARHVAWLTDMPGTPASEPGGDVGAYVRGLADMYVDDPRFARNYATAAGGSAGAEFVRDALRAYADANLS
jgi:DNA-binding transcriptional MerR regulator